MPCSLARTREIVLRPFPQDPVRLCDRVIMVRTRANMYTSVLVFQYWLSLKDLSLRLKHCTKVYISLHIPDSIMFVQCFLSLFNIIPISATSVTSGTLLSASECFSVLSVR